MISRVMAGLYKRSIEVIGFLEGHYRSLIAAWVLLAAIACGLRVAFSGVPVDGPADLARALIPYAIMGFVLVKMGMKKTQPSQD